MRRWIADKSAGRLTHFQLVWPQYFLFHFNAVASFFFTSFSSSSFLLLLHRITMAIHRAFIRPLLHTANKFGCPYPLVPFISMIIHQLRQYYPFRPIGCTCNWMNPSIGWRFNAVEDAKLTAAVTTSWLLFHTARSHANRILMEHAGNRTIEHHFTMVFNWAGAQFHRQRCRSTLSFVCSIDVAIGSPSAKFRRCYVPSSSMLRPYFNSLGWFSAAPFNRIFSFCFCFIRFLPVMFRDAFNVLRGLRLIKLTAFV